MSNYQRTAAWLKACGKERAMKTSSPSSSVWTLRNSLRPGLHRA